MSHTNFSEKENNFETKNLKKENLPNPSDLIFNLVWRFAEFVLLFFIGTIIIFFVINRLPGDPWVLMVGEPVTDAKLQFIEDQKDAWGYYSSVIGQYFSYLWNFISGNWGYSISSSPDTPVSELISGKFPKTLELLGFGMIWALIPSILFGFISGKNRGKIADRIILGLVAVLFILPTGAIGMLFQYIFAVKLNWLDATGFQGIQYIAYKPDITGIRSIDSFLHGDFAVFGDTVAHLLMPSLVVSFGLTAIGILIIRRLVILKDTKEFTRPRRNYARIGLIFLYLSFILAMTETIFALNGNFMLFVNAINRQDYFLILIMVTRSFVIFQLLAFICDIVGIIVEREVSMRQVTSQTAKNQSNHQNYGIAPETDEPIVSNANNLSESNAMKEPLQRKEFNVKSVLLRPALIFGLVVLFSTIIMAIVAVSKYNLAEINMVGPSDPWSSPSSENPLGTGKFGRDVLARALYGFVVPLSRIIPVVFFAGLLGLSLGFFLTNKNQIIDNSINFLAKIGKILPSLNLILILLVIYIPQFSTLLILSALNVFTFGILIGHRTLSESVRKKLEMKNLGRLFLNSIFKLMGNLFILISLILIANFTVNFFGFGDNSLVSWGTETSYARNHIYDAPWAAYSPMVAFYILQLAVIMIACSFYDHPNDR